MEPPLAPLLGTQRPWRPDLGMARHPEVLRDHADDGVRNVVDPQREAVEARTGAKLPHPQPAARDRHAISPGDVGRVERAADHRRHTKHGEELPGDGRRRHALGDAAARRPAAENADGMTEVGEVVATSSAFGAHWGVAVARQWFIESVVLALVGGTLGLALAGWGSRVLGAQLATTQSAVTLDLSLGSTRIGSSSSTWIRLAQLSHRPRGTPTTIGS